MSRPFAVDTNILVYVQDTVALDKRRIALDVLYRRPKVPTQVISEYLNTVRKLLPITKEDLLFQTAELLQNCETITTLPSTLSLASLLVKKYRFQLFDAVIVAASPQGGCEILYSEDMQTGLVVNGSLMIVNPFL